MADKQKIIQLDFYDGYYVGDYNTIAEAAIDNGMEWDTLSKALRNKNGVMKKNKLRFMYEEDYKEYLKEQEALKIIEQANVIKNYCNEHNSKCEECKIGKYFNCSTKSFLSPYMWGCTDEKGN